MIGVIGSSKQGSCTSASDRLVQPHHSLVCRERVRKQVVGSLCRRPQKLGTFHEVPDRLALDPGLVSTPLPAPQVVCLVHEYERTRRPLPTRLLDRGRDYCFLYTDLANPTSNRIYHEVGYERGCDSVEYVFDVASR